MSEVFYVSVVWTAGDIITEAKLDNMTANDRAVDAMANGIQLTERADPSTPSSNNIHLYAKDKSGIPALYAINDAGTVYEISETTPTYIFPVASVLFTTTMAASPLPVIKASSITRVFAYANTGPVGADIIVDINKNGSSIWGSTPANRLKILAGAQSGSQTSFDTTSLALDDILTPDIDQVGSSTAGSDLVIAVKTK